MLLLNNMSHTLLRTILELDLGTTLSMTASAIQPGNTLMSGLPTVM